MTREGIQTGRGTASSQTERVVGTSSQNLLLPAPTRIAIVIGAPPTNRFTISLAENAVLDQGITLYPGGNPLVLTVEEHGDIVTRYWAAIGATASQTVSVFEVFLDV